jgi:hypothetical protein
MYFPRAPKEPSGCLQTFLITRAIFGVLAIPLVIIGGALVATLITLYIFTVNPLLALIPLGIGVLGIYALARWEKVRIEKENPPEEE